MPNTYLSVPAEGLFPDVLYPPVVGFCFGIGRWQDGAVWDDAETWGTDNLELFLTLDQRQASGAAEDQYRRYIELLGPDAGFIKRVLSDKLQEPHRDADGNLTTQLDGSPTPVESTVVSAEFTNLYAGGNAEGVLSTTYAFNDHPFAHGDFVRMSYAPGEPWYLGKVVDISENSVSGVDVRLQGLFTEFSEVYPGGHASEGGELNLEGDGLRRYGPVLFARSNYYQYDPDSQHQRWYDIRNYKGVMDVLWSDWAAGVSSNILYGYIEPSEPGFYSSVIRGDESLTQLIHGMAWASGGQAHGVAPSGEHDAYFFSVNPNPVVMGQFQIGANCTDHSSENTGEIFYNRLRIIGGYVFDADGDAFGYVTHGVETDSVLQYGEQAISLYLPWIRNDADASNFGKRFFDEYAVPKPTYTVKTKGLGFPVLPWCGQFQFLAKDGSLISQGQPHTAKCSFNEAPVWTVEFGPHPIDFPEVNPGDRKEEGGGGNPGPDGELCFGSLCPENKPSEKLPCECKPLPGKLAGQTRFHGYLLEDLEPRDPADTTPSISMVQLWDNTSGLLVSLGSNYIVEASNYDVSLSAKAGTYVKVEQIPIGPGCEWSFYWVGCEEEGASGPNSPCGDACACPHGTHTFLLPGITANELDNLNLEAYEDLYSLTEGDLTSESQFFPTPPIEGASGGWWELRGGVRTTLVDVDSYWVLTQEGQGAILRAYGIVYSQSNDEPAFSVAPLQYKSCDFSSETGGVFKFDNDHRGLKNCVLQLPDLATNLLYFSIEATFDSPILGEKTVIWYEDPSFGGNPFVVFGVPNDFGDSLRAYVLGVFVESVVSGSTIEIKGLPANLTKLKVLLNNNRGSATVEEFTEPDKIEYWGSDWQDVICITPKDCWDEAKRNPAPCT